MPDRCIGAGCARARDLARAPYAATLAEIARAKHIPLTEALSRAIEAHRREVFLEAVASGFEALHEDPDAWAEEQAEGAPWERNER